MPLLSILEEIQCQCQCFSSWKIIHLNHSCHTRAGIHPQQSLQILHDTAQEELMCSKILITCSSNQNSFLLIAMCFTLWELHMLTFHCPPRAGVAPKAEWRISQRVRSFLYSKFMSWISSREKYDCSKQTEILLNPAKQIFLISSQNVNLCSSHSLCSVDGSNSSL